MNKKELLQQITVQQAQCRKVSNLLQQQTLVHQSGAPMDAVQEHVQQQIALIQRIWGNIHADVNLSQSFDGGLYIKPGSTQAVEVRPS
jgi:hypothetical protein